MSQLFFNLYKRHFIEAQHPSFKTRDDQPETDSKFESIAAEADRIVSTDRQEDYGHPLDNYTEIANLAKAMRINVYTPEGAALFHILVKLSRENHRHKRDNLVDIAGYAKVVELIYEERERRNGARPYSSFGGTTGCCCDIHGCLD